MYEDVIFDSTSLYREYERKAEVLSKQLSLRYNRNNIAGLATKLRISKDQVSVIEMARDIAEEIYPGNSDIHFEVSPHVGVHKNTYGVNDVLDVECIDKFIISGFYIVIRFPELTIENGERSTILKNLFTRLPISIESDGTLSFDVIQGTRTKVSIPEYLTGYAHSHLHSVAFSNKEKQCEFSSFCIGSGDIGNATSLVSGEKTIDPDLLRLLLLQIDPFVKWESIEGGPYKHMSKIDEKKLGVETVKIERVQDFFRDYVLFGLRRGYLSINVDWKFYNKKYSIVDNEKFDEMFRPLSAGSSGSYFYYKDETGAYYKRDTVNQARLPSNPNWLPFRGQKVFFEVEGRATSFGIDNKLYIHPKIKNYVKSRLEYYANSPKIREIGVKRTSSNIDS